MCGIFAYIGNKNAREMALKGLKKLEYRGYDSAGLAGIQKGKILFWKEVGKVSILEKEVESNPQDLEVAIAQTRWATHGGVTQANAHPHLDEKSKMALVHNGIIENYDVLKEKLLAAGVKFRSETDTEVIVHLIAQNYSGNLVEAVQKTLPQLKGAYAFVMIHTDHPDTIIAVAKECPLVIGIGENEAFVSSDYHAFAFFTRQVMYLADAEIASVQANKLEIYNAKQEKITRKAISIEALQQETTKGNFEHYTLKEIFEQPGALRAAILGRFIQDYGTAVFDDLQVQNTFFEKVDRILILACGTSYHAGYTAAYMFEEMAHIPCRVEIASEFRYKNAAIEPYTLAIAISQSGETADTIAALREVRAKGIKTLSLCNVYGSTIARESDACIYLKAGPEIGVCSTKAFTSSLAVLALVALFFARSKHMSKSEGVAFLQALEKIPEQVKEVLNTFTTIQQVAKKYVSFNNFFFLGRNYLFPAALEGALKLKEISYVNANGYPAGELKHGPIAIIGPECATVALCANKATYDKMINNLMEVKVRKGPILAIAEVGQVGIEKIADDVLWVPKTIDPLAPLLTAIVTQLLAYEIAHKLGSDIDQPRNLAKSVTVE